jgi:transposase
MHIDTAKVRSTSGRIHTRILLRTSYREGNKVKHKTIANLSSCSEKEIEIIRFAFKHKNILPILQKKLNEPTEMKLGFSIGAVYVLYEIAKRLGIDQSLGKDANGKLALWQTFARIIDHGSRLSGVRLAGTHAACDVIGLNNFTEDVLYKNLEWISAKQTEIENRLFNQKLRKGVQLFLYDVTSSYLEGDKNAYAAYGYNRDQKKGKKQIVIGLVTDSEGDPVTIQVFPGNTKDNMTLVEQVHKLNKRFNVQTMTIVGDRGMIKTTQLKELSKELRYITAITKPQVTNLINQDKLKLECFSDKVQEISDNGIRYIFRRNPIRQKEIQLCRNEKFLSAQQFVKEKNKYLKDHPKASVEVAIKNIKEKLKKLRIEKWVKLEDLENRNISITKDEKALTEESALDGCYVIKTNVELLKQKSSKVLHDRYKDLKYVEYAFRTMKTDYLEIRPHYVRKAVSTEGHVFVVMLAYKMIRYLKQAWESINVTVEEAIIELSSIRGIILDSKTPNVQLIPQPSQLGQELLQALNIELPEIHISKGIVVATRKKLKKSC